MRKNTKNCWSIQMQWRVVTEIKSILYYGYEPTSFVAYYAVTWLFRDYYTKIYGESADKWIYYWMLTSFNLRLRNIEHCPWFDEIHEKKIRKKWPKKKFHTIFFSNIAFFNKSLSVFMYFFYFALTLFVELKLRGKDKQNIWLL